MTGSRVAPETARMRRLKRIVEISLVFVTFPVVCFVLLGTVIAVGVDAFLIWLGAMLSAWFLVAFIVPLFLGVMAPSEIVDNIRSRRVSRTHHEGEPLAKRRMEAPHLDVRLDADLFLLSGPGAPRTEQNGARS